MRVFSLLLFFGVFSLSCNKEIKHSDDGVILPSCLPIIISSDIYKDLDPNQASVIELSIEEDCLTIMLGVNGCVYNYVINMVSDGSIAESLPPQITFDFQDENPLLCEAYITLERQYDLSPIRELVERDISIRFRNSDFSIIYQK